MLSWFQANDKYLSCPRTISKHQKWSPGCILSQIDTLHRPLGRKPNFWWGSYWWSGAQSQIHRITLCFAWQTVHSAPTEGVMHLFDQNWWFWLIFWAKWDGLDLTRCQKPPQNFFDPQGTVCSNGFYADIWSQHQVHQYKSCLKSFLKFFGSFELP